MIIFIFPLQVGDPDHRCCIHKLLLSNIQMKSHRLKNRRKKGKPYVSLLAVITTMTIIILVIIVDDGNKGLAAFIASPGSILSQDLENQNDMTVQEFLQPGEEHASYDSDNRFPEEKEIDPNNISQDSIEILSQADRFAADSEKEYQDINDSQNVSGKSIDDDQYASRRIRTIQTGDILTIGEFVIAASVNNREPAGLANIFSSSTEKVYAFLEARNITENTAVRFVWYHGDNEMATVALPVYRGITMENIFK
jgi:hypothetical protein